VEATLADRLVFVIHAYEEASQALTELQSSHNTLSHIHKDNIVTIDKVGSVVKAVREKMKRLDVCCPAGPTKENIQAVMARLDVLSEQLAQA
jgi:hypothetical protein